MSGYDAVETPWGCYADISEPTDNDLWRHVVSYGGYRHDELWPADSAAVASATGDEWLAGATAVDEAVASSSAVSSAIEQTWPDPAGVLLRHNISTVNTAGPGETGMTQLSGEMKELAQAYQSYGHLIHGVKSTILKQLDSYDTKYSLAGLAGERMKQSFARHVAPSFAAIITAAVDLLEGKELPESKAPKEKAHGPLGLLESMWDATVGQLYGMVKGLAGFGEGGWSWSNLGDAWGALGTHVLANITYSPTGLMLGLPVLDQTVGLPGFQPGDMGYQLFQQAADFIDVDDWETNPWAAVGTDIGNVLTVVGTDGVGGALRSLGEVAESSKFGAIAKTGSAAARAGDAILTASPYLHPFSTTLVKGLGQVPKIVDHLRTPGRAGRELDAAGPSHVRDTDRPPPADPPHEPPVPGSVGEAVEKSPGGTAGPHPSAPVRPAADAPRTPPDGTGHNPAAAAPPGVSPPVRPAPGTPDVPGGPRPVHPRPDASPDPARPAGPPHQSVPPDDRVVPSSPPPRPPTAAAPHPAAEAAHVGPHPGEVPHGEGRPGTEQPGSGAVAPHPSAETGAAAGKPSHSSDSPPPQREHPDAKPAEVRREPAQPVTPLVEGREAPKEAASGSSGKPPGGPPRKPPGPGREAEPPAEGEPNGKPEREPDGAEPQRAPGETPAPSKLPPGDPGLPPRDQGAYVAHVDRNTGEVTVEHRPAEAEPPSAPDREGPAPDHGRPEPPGTAEPGHPGAQTGLPAPGSDEARLEGHDTHDVQDNPRIKASTKFQLAMFAGLRMSSLLHSGFDMWDIWHGVPHPPTGGPTDLPSSRPNPRGPRRGPGGNPDGTVARFDPDTGTFRLVRPENAAAAPGVRPHPEPPRELPEREGPRGAEPDSGRGAENPDGAARRGPDEDPEPRPGDDGPIGPNPPPKGPDSPEPGGGRAAEPERTPPESRGPERGRGEETAPDPESPGKPPGGPPRTPPAPPREPEPPEEGDPKKGSDEDGTHRALDEPAPSRLPEGDPGLPPRTHDGPVAHVDRETGEISIEHGPRESEPRPPSRSEGDTESPGPHSEEARPERGLMDRAINPEEKAPDAGEPRETGGPERAEPPADIPAELAAVWDRLPPETRAMLTEMAGRLPEKALVNKVAGIAASVAGRERGTALADALDGMGPAEHAALRERLTADTGKAARPAKPADGTVYATPEDLKQLGKDSGKGLLGEAADAWDKLAELESRGVHVDHAFQGLIEDLGNAKAVAHGNTRTELSQLLGDVDNVLAAHAQLDVALALTGMHPALLAELGLPGLRIEKLEQPLVHNGKKTDIDIVARLGDGTPVRFEVKDQNEFTTTTVKQSGERAPNKSFAKAENQILLQRSSAGPDAKVIALFTHEVNPEVADRLVAAGADCVLRYHGFETFSIVSSR
ncbi:hypothetical protein [Amycolatopsis sp. cg13]|uniref:WXG100-like domain-containing protein n=1 Tax=Amycolatopsis sp. cg13 TaxID=3238807 RepID=UPI00352402AF